MKPTVPISFNHTDAQSREWEILAEVTTCDGMLDSIVSFQGRWRNTNFIDVHPDDAMMVGLEFAILEQTRNHSGEADELVGRWGQYFSAVKVK